MRSLRYVQSYVCYRLGSACARRWILWVQLERVSMENHVTCANIGVARGYGHVVRVAISLVRAYGRILWT